MRPVLLVVAICVALGASGCLGGAGHGQARDKGGASGGKVTVSTAGWTTDFSQHRVPLSEFSSGGPPRDGIPPIDRPKFVDQGEARKWLAGREPVLVVEARGTARAYPVQMLVWHEIVNDDLGGRPIAVTLCPLCNSSVVFDRRVDGRELTFGTTGNLRNSDLVMWDRQTESWWQQFSGEALVGRLLGKRLRTLNSQTLSFRDFRKRYPDGDVLSRDTGFRRAYGRTPYAGYHRPNEQPFLLQGKADGRLPAKERVAAVFVGKDTAVVPFSQLRKKPVVQFRLGTTPAVVFFKADVASALDAARIADSADSGTSAAFDRRVGGRPLDFEPRGQAIVDRQSGTTWDITGRATTGPLAGARLKLLRHDQQFWFALAAFLPDARILAR